jgi:cytosine/uracil/thiamine/allantoin permease
MVGLLIWVLVFGLICYLIFWVMGYLGMPEPIRKVVTVVIVIIAILYLLGYVMPRTGAAIAAGPIVGSRRRIPTGMTSLGNSHPVQLDESAKNGRG